MVIAGSAIPLPETPAYGRARRILELPEGDRPRGMFAANDLVALGALQVFHRGGLQVPHDMSVVGYDDIEYAQQAAVPLTTVRQPAYEMGYAGADLLVAHMEGRGTDLEQHLVFQPELVVRDSTLAPGKADVQPDGGPAPP